MDLEAIRDYFDRVARRGNDHIVWGDPPETHYVDPVRGRRGRRRQHQVSRVDDRLQGTKPEWQERFEQADRTGYSGRYPQGIVAKQIELRTRYLRRGR